MIKDQNKCGLVVWGTKLGEYLFHIHNLDNDNYQVRKTLKDVMKRMNIEGTNKSFWSFEETSECLSFTAYRTLRDWSGYGQSIGRDGYFAVSVFVPKNLHIPGASLVSMMEHLQQYYWDHYVIKSGGVDQYRIDKHAEEDFGTMVSMMDQLAPVQQRPELTVSFGDKEAMKRYPDTHALASEIDQVFLGYYAPYQSLIMLPEADIDAFSYSFEEAIPVTVPKQKRKNQQNGTSDKIPSFQASGKRSSETFETKEIRHQTPVKTANRDGQVISKNKKAVFFFTGSIIFLGLAAAYIWFFWPFGPGEEEQKRAIALGRMDSLHQAAQQLPSNSIGDFI
ncbi:MAG: hypothetical protein AAFO69_04200, partial [Bacteroidota bacterium]